MVDHRFPKPRHLTTGLLLTLVITACLLVTAVRADNPGRAYGATTRTKAEREARIAELIQLLGDAEFSTREKAQAELERMGLEAFDALNAARESDDIEISLRARYLVRSMQVDWSRDSDSQRVKHLLHGYGSKPEKERHTLIEKLGRLENAEGLFALCRLVRYEESPHLSRRAALLVMQLQRPEEEAKRHKMSADLRNAVSVSKRAAARWLRVYAQMLDGAPDALMQWQQVIADELKTLGESLDQSNRDVIRELMWWYADQLREAGRDNHAIAVLRQSIELLESSDKQLQSAIDWFRAQEAWQLVVATSERFADTIKANPLLLYRVADAHWKLGQIKQAEQHARQARQAVGKEPSAHLVVAANLQQDGLFRWAEFEYRYVIDQIKNLPNEAVGACFLLSEMLHDVGRHQDAGDVLKTLVEAAETNEQVQQRIQKGLGRETNSIKSRMYYFYARHNAKQNDTKKQREQLLRAYEADPLDADVLIGMFRVSDADPAWKKQTRARLEKAVAAYRKQIADLEKQAKVRQNPFGQRRSVNVPLATANNQLAWLIANTEGDFDEAIRCSQRSLQLRPNTAGYLDTLAHCFHAKGDDAKAVEYQSRAAALEPHSHQIIKKLELFKKALAESKKALAESKKAATPAEKP